MKPNRNTSKVSIMGKSQPQHQHQSRRRNPTKRQNTLASLVDVISASASSHASGYGGRHDSTSQNRSFSKFPRHIHSGGSIPRQMTTRGHQHHPRRRQNQSSTNEPTKTKNYAVMRSDHQLVLDPGLFHFGHLDSHDRVPDRVWIRNPKMNHKVQQIPQDLQINSDMSTLELLNHSIKAQSHTFPSYTYDVQKLKGHGTYAYGMHKPKMYQTYQKYKHNYLIQTNQQIHSLDRMDSDHIADQQKQDNRVNHTQSNISTQNNRSSDPTSPSTAQGILHQGNSSTTNTTARGLLSLPDAKQIATTYLNQFSVMSYNLLSSLHVSENEYRGTPVALLSYGFRIPKIISQITQVSPSIAALQEVDLPFSTLVPLLNALGYQSTFKLRRFANGSTSGEGIMLTWKATEWKCIAQASIEYSSYPIQSHAKDQVALAVLLESVPPQYSLDHDNSQTDTKYQPRTVCVVNTHILFNSNRGEIKASQGQSMMNGVHAWLEKLKSNAEIVLTHGDSHSISSSNHSASEDNRNNALLFTRESVLGKTTSQQQKGPGDDVEVSLSQDSSNTAGKHPISSSLLQQFDFSTANIAPFFDVVILLQKQQQPCFALRSSLLQHQYYIVKDGCAELLNDLTSIDAVLQLPPSLQNGNPYEVFLDAKYRSMLTDYEFIDSCPILPFDRESATIQRDYDSIRLSSMVRLESIDFNNYDVIHQAAQVTTAQFLPSEDDMTKLVSKSTAAHSRSSRSANHQHQTLTSLSSSYAGNSTDEHGNINLPDYFNRVLDRAMGAVQVRNYHEVVAQKENNEPLFTDTRLYYAVRQYDGLYQRVLDADSPGDPHYRRELLQKSHNSGLLRALLQSPSDGHPVPSKAVTTNTQLSSDVSQPQPTLHLHRLPPQMTVTYKHRDLVLDHALLPKLSHLPPSKQPDAIHLIPLLNTEALLQLNQHITTLAHTRTALPHATQTAGTITNVIYRQQQQQQQQRLQSSSDLKQSMNDVDQITDQHSHHNTLPSVSHPVPITQQSGFILCGDFNATAESELLQYIRSGSLPLDFHRKNFDGTFYSKSAHKLLKDLIYDQHFLISLQSKHDVHPRSAAYPDAILRRILLTSWDADVIYNDLMHHHTNPTTHSSTITTLQILQSMDEYYSHSYKTYLNHITDDLKQNYPALNPDGLQTYPQPISKAQLATLQQPDAPGEVPFETVITLTPRENVDQLYHMYIKSSFASIILEQYTYLLSKALQSHRSNSISTMSHNQNHQGEKQRTDDLHAIIPRTWEPGRYHQHLPYIDQSTPISSPMLSSCYEFIHEEALTVFEAHLTPRSSPGPVTVVPSPTRVLSTTQGQGKTPSGSSHRNQAIKAGHAKHGGNQHNPRSQPSKQQQQRQQQHQLKLEDIPNRLVPITEHHTMKHLNGYTSAISHHLGPFDSVYQQEFIPRRFRFSSCQSRGKVFVDHILVGQKSIYEVMSQTAATSPQPSSSTDEHTQHQHAHRISTETASQSMSPFDIVGVLDLPSDYYLIRNRHHLPNIVEGSDHYSLVTQLQWH